jgi:hypothetical protein
MYKLHCDLCGRDITNDKNTTRVTWENNIDYEAKTLFIFRKKRKLRADVCDKCIECLKNNAIEC